VICWTDFTFLRQRYLNNLHFSGIGISAVYGARWVFNDRFFIGDIAEVLLYSTKPTPYEQSLIEGYLAWKWGLVSKLPSGHPYKSAPPAGFRA
jgi:hypothetical protein